MKRLLFLASTIVSFYSYQADAMIDLRAHYGMHVVDPSTLNSVNTSVPAITKVGGIGADLIVSLPLVPIGFGLRYEKLTDKAGTSPLDYEFNLTRTSLIGNFRLIDTLIMLGAIGTVGLSHSNEYIVGGVSKSAGSVSSFTVGVEAGVKVPFLGLLAGAEAGYQKMSFSDWTGGYAGSTDFNGIYTKIFLGISLL